jgi:lysophospholipase L1-like esterase
MLALCLLGACSDGPHLAPLGADATVLAFGDSLTRGVGARPEESYPSVLADLTGLRVVNAGVPGEKTAGGRKRLPRVLAAVEPDLMLLLEGGNDILRSVRRDATRDNLAAMVEMAVEAGVAVVLIGVPDRLVFADSAAFYRDVAEQYGLVFDEDSLAGLLRDQDLKSDAIHLNAEGYRRLAEAIHELLEVRGAL